MGLRSGACSERGQRGRGGRRLRRLIPPPTSGEALAPMKLRNGLATLAVVASLFSGLRAFAQTESESTDAPEANAKPEAPAEERMAPPPREPEPAPPPPAQAYVPLAPTPPPARIENPGATIRFGVLAQPQFEMAGAPSDDGIVKNLYLRRLRLIVGGTLFKSIEYFVQLDWPNLFKWDPNDTMDFNKSAPGLNIQDAFVTYKPIGELIKIDAGFMLPPTSHNGLESAATLYGVDYFANTFRRNLFGIADPFMSSGESPIGRDVGVQARALALNGHIDLRAGLFQGFRVGAVPASTGGTPGVVGSLNMFEAAGRLQINLLDAEPGFFYQGTYHGKKKIASVGGFIDYQSYKGNAYKYLGGDLFVDLPVGPGVATAQATVVQWDGGGLLPTLRKDRAIMAEVGYLIGPIMLSPFGRFERLVAPKVPMDATMANSPLIPDPMNPSEDRYGGGLSFWPYGHNSNLKASFLHVHRTVGLHDFNAFNLQWQVYYY